MHSIFKQETPTRNNKKHLALVDKFASQLQALLRNSDRANLASPLHEKQNSLFEHLTKLQNDGLVHIRH